MTDGLDFRFEIVSLLRCRSDPTDITVEDFRNLNGEAKKACDARGQAYCFHVDRLTEYGAVLERGY